MENYRNSLGGFIDFNDFNDFEDGNVYLCEKVIYIMQFLPRVM